MFVLRDVFVGFNTQGLSGPELEKELRVSSGASWLWGGDRALGSPAGAPGQGDPGSYLMG